MVPHLLEAGVDKRVIDVVAPGEIAIQYKDGPGVEADFIPHDVFNCCWHISYGYDRLFFATDCSTLDSVTAKNYGLYLIEANHTRAEIQARIADKQARGEFAYETRAAQNHLSQEQALDWLARNAGPRSRYIFLHQHKDKEDSDA